MRVAIIGAGSVGSAIAKGLKGTAYEVSLGVRDPQSDTVRSLAADTGASVDYPPNAAAAADMVILALPWRVAFRCRHVQIFLLAMILTTVHSSCARMQHP